MLDFLQTNSSEIITLLITILASNNTYTLYNKRTHQKLQQGKRSKTKQEKVARRPQ